jgi:hypothetical protein
MKTKQCYLMLTITCLLVVGSACSFDVSTANMSSLKMGKEKPVSQAVTSFAAQDVIYATAVISNNPGTVKVKGSLIVEDVEGQKPGPIPSLETTMDVYGSADASFTFTPSNPWPTGKYKFEAVMLNENGEAKDQKVVSFTIE